MESDIQQQSKRYSQLLVDLLIEAVKERGFKTTVLAKSIGIGQATMSRYISGTREMPLSTIMAICLYTEIDPNPIFRAAYRLVTDHGVEDSVQLIDQVVTHPEDYEVAALRDPNKTLERDTPRD